VFAVTLFGLPSLLPVLVFATFAFLAWWVLDLLAAGQSRAHARLDELKSPRTKDRDLTALKKPDAMTKVLQRASPALAKPLQPKSELEMSKLRARLSAAGFRSELARSSFLGLKFIGLLAGLFFGGGTLLVLRGANQQSFIGSVLSAAAFFYLPDLAVLILASYRKKAIFHSLPDALDLLVVCVEAGLGLDQAMRRVADEMKRAYPVICEEFSLSNLQLQMGRPKGEVLHELGARNGVADLRALATVLIQADRFGSGIAQALRVQSDSMRVRRRQLAEEKAAKTAVKLIFPLVMFIFPGIFVVLVGPAAVTMVRELFPKMNN
jgi:tight adherence protein C